MNGQEMNGYREIGQIIRLQIQRRSLKQPLEPRTDAQRSPDQFYDPSQILASSELWIADSVASVARGEDYILDIHAAAHPHSRNRGNGNMLSVGFTSHYDKMRDRFGSHLTDGIAGENILVESAVGFELNDLQPGLGIRRADGGFLEFGEIAVAAPCVEFSRFCLGNRYAEPKPTSEALRFLDGGTRGFYAYISSGLPAMIRTGDTLLVRET